MKKVIISACLLGENCRYDGKTKKVSTVIDTFTNYEIIPFCPEAPLFGTPRERISVIEIDGIKKIITDDTKKDVTNLLKNEIDKFIKLHPDPDTIVLKSKSPSCGFGTTPILNEKMQLIYKSNGIAADIFLKNYKKIPIKDENHFI